MLHVIFYPQLKRCNAAVQESNAGDRYRGEWEAVGLSTVPTMYFGGYISHVIAFFISSRLLPLDMLYFKSVAMMMHDV